MWFGILITYNYILYYYYLLEKYSKMLNLGESEKDRQDTKYSQIKKLCSSGLEYNEAFDIEYT